MQEQDVRVGQVVSAFHPRMMGVVKTGRVVGVGLVWVKVDFGAMLGGIVRVPARDIVEVQS